MPDGAHSEDSFFDEIAALQEFLSAHVSGSNFLETKKC
jgi:hypothetical protein